MNTSLLLTFGGVYGALLVYLFLRFKRGHRRAAIMVSFLTAFFLFPFVVKGCGYISWLARLPRMPGVEIFVFLLLSVLLWIVLLFMERLTRQSEKITNIHEALCFIFPRMHPLLLFSVVGLAGFIWVFFLFFAAYAAVES